MLIYTLYSDRYLLSLSTFWADFSFCVSKRESLFLSVRTSGDYYWLHSGADCTKNQFLHNVTSSMPSIWRHTNTHSKIASRIETPNSLIIKCGEIANNKNVFLYCSYIESPFLRPIKYYYSFERRQESTSHHCNILCDVYNEKTVFILFLVSIISYRFL